MRILKQLLKRRSSKMNYDELYGAGGFNAASREWLVEYTDLPEFAQTADGTRLTLLDAGCGDGEWSEVLAEWYDVTGFDLSETGIAAASERASGRREQLRFGCRNALTLEPADQFDVIFARAPSFLNHPTDAPQLADNICTLLQHCRRRLYYIKYSRQPYERWEQSGYFADFDTDAENAPDSRWYYNDPARLEELLNTIAPATVRTTPDFYLVAVVEATGD